MAATNKNHSIPIPPLASQWLDASKGATPERRLLAAVLQDAVQIIRRGPEYHEHRELTDTYRDAIAWVAADGDTWPFCFVALCEALGFDANRVRTRLLGMCDDHVQAGEAPSNVARSLPIMSTRLK